MKTISPEKPPTTVTVKLDPSVRARISALAMSKKRTPHYLLKEAIREYIDREESQQNFIKVAERSYEHYKETGSHISLDEFSAWVDVVEQKPGTSMLVCHEYSCRHEHKKRYCAAL